MLVSFSFIQGVPKKTLFSGILAITALWKVLELKVGGVLKTSGNSLCDRHKNFPNWPFRSWENWVQRWQLNLKNREKNGVIFFLDRTHFFRHPVPNTLNLCWTIKSTFWISCGIPPKGNDSEKLKDATEASEKSWNKTTKFSQFFSIFLG